MSTHGEERSHGTLDCPGIESINIIYNGTLDNSAARKWIVDMYDSVAREYVLFALPQELPHDFQADLYKKLITSWPHSSTHQALEHKLAETEAKYERSKEYARTKEEELNRLGATNAKVKEG